MGQPPATTSEAEVLAVVGWLTARGAIYQVNGGWGVDALVGRQTRPHRDLDVFVDEVAVPDLLAWLRHRGYQVVEDWLPVRIELASPCGRVDVHPMAIQANGDGVQQGLGGDVFVHAATDRMTGHIGGHPVSVACRKWLIELRQGYDPRPEDLHDLALLAALED